MERKVFLGLPSSTSPEYVSFYYIYDIYYTYVIHIIDMIVERYKDKSWGMRVDNTMRKSRLREATIASTAVSFITDG